MADAERKTTLFGYVKPFKPDLRVRELETYKAVYCGLCGQLGEAFGPAARLTLSYDFVFLAMLHYAVTPDARPVFERRWCFVNPYRKRLMCRPGECLAFSADTALLLLYYKLLDNMTDSKGLKRIGWGMLKPAAASAHQKAAARRPDCEALIAQTMVEQHNLERERCDSIDAACEPTAKAMAGIFTRLSPEPRQQRVLERMGYLLGRYVYLCDALDDLSGDIKTGSYNPFALRYRLDQDAGQEQLAEVYRYGKDVLYLTAGEAAKAYQLLDTGLFSSILDNVFYQGLRAGADEILLRRSPGKITAEYELPDGCTGCPAAHMQEESSHCRQSREPQNQDTDVR